MGELALRCIFTKLGHVPHCRDLSRSRADTPQRHCPPSAGAWAPTDLFLHTPHQRPGRDSVRNYSKYGRKLTGKCQDKTTKWEEEGPGWPLSGRHCKRGTGEEGVSLGTSDSTERAQTRRTRLPGTRSLDFWIQSAPNRVGVQPSNFHCAEENTY